MTERMTEERVEIPCRDGDAAAGADARVGGLREAVFRLAERRQVSGDVQLLRLEGDSGGVRAPGQFAAVSVPGRFLRRPFSVCDWGDGWLTLLVQRVGAGTEQLQELPLGSELSILTGLGRGFERMPGMTRPLLLGGGSGLSPLVGLCRRLAAKGFRPVVLLGFREEAERFGAEFFPGGEARYAGEIFGELEKTEHDCFYGCGSLQMMRELCRREQVPGQVAFDVRMGCGFGACMGCALRTAGGMKRVCKDGPVFRKEELLWED